MKVVLACGPRGVWVSLSLVEDIDNVLKTQHLHDPKGPPLRHLVGVPIMIDKKGSIWPFPAADWSLWEAKPLKMDMLVSPQEGEEKL